MEAAAARPVPSDSQADEVRYGLGEMRLACCRRAARGGSAPRGCGMCRKPCRPRPSAAAYRIEALLARQDYQPPCLHCKVLRPGRPQHSAFQVIQKERKATPFAIRNESELAVLAARTASSGRCKPAMRGQFQIQHGSRCSDCIGGRREGKLLRMS